MRYNLFLIAEFKVKGELTQVNSKLFQAFLSTEKIIVEFIYFKAIHNHAVLLRDLKVSKSARAALILSRELYIELFIHVEF